MVFIEYDVTQKGEIELVALINAIEDDDADPDGEARVAWRVEHEDMGMGCVSVRPEELSAMEQEADPRELTAIVERIILADRANKEEVRS